MADTLRCKSIPLVLAALLTPWLHAPASNLDTIGVTLLRQVTTNLNGSGVRVGQAEAQATGNGDWEVNPLSTNPPVNLFVSDFSYYSNTVANTYPNSLGVESGHADEVAEYFFGLPNGVATNVSHIDEFEGDYFIGVVIPYETPISNKLVNQSFTASASQQLFIDNYYDNYAATYGTLFVSAVGDGGGVPVSPPSTCYNGIGVAAYGGASSVGPTTDNGRAKPDISAPAGETSDASPQVAGAAAILVQAALRGDGGASVTNLAADFRATKALLLNGAIKPPNWTNSTSYPLDQRYGSGVLNVFESWKQLSGGIHPFNASSSTTVGGAHPPTSGTNNISVLSGWDFNTNTSSASMDVINHYYFKLPSGAASNYIATATLVWERQNNQAAVNELDLYLYNTASSNLVALSSNSTDNIKHLYLSSLPAGRYDLQVLKKGGSGTNFVTAGETYALAFEFVTASLHAALVRTNLVLTWPVYPAGFYLESAPGVSTLPNWSAYGQSPVVTNNENVVTIPSPSGSLFFRLARQ